MRSALYRSISILGCLEGVTNWRYFKSLATDRKQMFATVANPSFSLKAGALCVGPIGLEAMTLQHTTTRRELLEELMSHRKIHLCHAIKVVGSIEAAEDVLQNTAIKCLSSKDIQRPEKMRSYVSKMVRNAALDYVRKHRNEIAEPFDEEHMLAKAGVDERCGQAVLENKQLLAEIVTAISQFPRRKRDAFIRHRVAGVPQNQIANDLSVSCTLVNFMIKEVDTSCRDIQA